jgi:hypothetical protein
VRAGNGESDSGGAAAAAAAAPVLVLVFAGLCVARVLISTRPERRFSSTAAPADVKAPTYAHTRHVFCRVVAVRFRFDVRFAQRRTI